MATVTPPAPAAPRMALPTDWTLADLQDMERSERVGAKLNSEDLTPSRSTYRRED